jgi:GR25 family glycosyltransferase involved in LPS biosynthesis
MDNTEDKVQRIQSVIDTYDVKRKTFINDESLSMCINKNVEHIYVINLERDQIRRNYVTVLMKKYNINFEFIIVNPISEDQYNAINNKSITIGETGCYLSHMYCLNDAIKNNYNNIIIFEDDIIFHKKFHELFKNIGDLGKFDILMLGAADFSFYKIHRNARIHNTIYKPHTNLLGAHAILYSRRGVEEMYRTRITNPTYFDFNLEGFLDIFEHSFFICFPNLVVAELSTTNLGHNFGVTNEIKESLYYRKCFSNAFDFNDYNFIYLLIFSNNTHNFFKIKKSFQENIKQIVEYSHFKIIASSTLEKENVKATMLKRMSYDFFTTNDLEFILFNKL